MTIFGVLLLAETSMNAAAATSNFIFIYDSLASSSIWVYYKGQGKVYKMGEI